MKARVQIALDETMNQLVHDSGEREDISCVDYSPDITLEPGVRYYWQVQAWDDAEDYGKSQVAFFETAAEMKTAAWIKSPFSKEVQALFRKEFTVEKKTVEARMYICGLGLYEAYINGEKIGDEYLAPYYNDYNLWLQYQTYDLTQQLREGDNCIGIMLGNGWYKGRFGFVDRMDELYGDTCHMICELHLTFADGTKQIIPSDTSWLCAPSPVLQSSIYDGEVWDSRKEIPAWAEVSCDAKEFVPSISCEESKKLLTPRLSLPVKIMERIKPVQLIHTVADEGSVPHVVPDILGQIDRILHKKDKQTDNVAVNTNHGSCAWADAATVIPWTLYTAYGDKTLLAQQYENMKSWVDYIRKVDMERCGGRYLWTDGFHFADWLALDNFHKDSCFGATDPYLVASAYCYYSATLTAKAATELNKTEDAAHYSELAEHIKKAFLCNAVYLTFSHFPVTLLALAIDAIPIILLLTNLEFFLRTSLFWIVGGVSLMVFINTFFLKRVFDRYINSEQTSKNDA